jgi:hypothetical protein
VKLDPGAHVFYAFGFALKSGCDNPAAALTQALETTAPRNALAASSHLSSMLADLVAEKEDKVGKWLAEDKKAVTWLRKEHVAGRMDGVSDGRRTFVY